MSWEDHLKEQRRLIILEGLSKTHDRKLNDTLLVRLTSQAGHDVSRTVIRSDILHLEEAGAVIRTAAMGFVVAEITERGEDHLALRTSLEGVARPSARRS